MGNALCPAQICVRLVARNQLLWRSIGCGAWQQTAEHEPHKTKRPAATFVSSSDRMFLALFAQRRQSGEAASNVAEFESENPFCAKWHGGRAAKLIKASKHLRHARTTTHLAIISAAYSAFYSNRNGISKYTHRSCSAFRQRLEAAHNCRPNIRREI